MKIKQNKKFAFFGYKAHAKKVMNVVFYTSMTKTSFPFADTSRKMATVRKEMSASTSTRDLNKTPIFQQII